MLSNNRIIKKILKKNITVSVAESCTGGLLASKFTSTPGISKIFNMGIIVYSNKAKSSLLKIPNFKLKKYGAVSKEICNDMLLGLKKISKSNLCITTTGIAGPSGGTKEKPIGTVYIGIKYYNKKIIMKNLYSGSRKIIQNKTIKDIFKIIDNLI